MKSCLGMLITLLILFAVIATGGLIWYLSQNTEFSRKPAPTAAPSATPESHPPGAPGPPRSR